VSTIKSMRLHIGILGQTNAGKSTLLNAITAQNVSIISPEPGTTTDPVQKTMELKPIHDSSFYRKKLLFDIHAEHDFPKTITK
jgi:small GTP-binding protein